MKQVISPFSGPSSHSFPFFSDTSSTGRSHFIEKPSSVYFNRLFDRKKFFSPFLKRATSCLLLVTFFFTFILPISEFSSLRAQSVPQLNSTRAFTNADLQPYVDAGRLQLDQSSFMNTVNAGEQAVEATWEAAVDAEINAIVNSVTSSDPVNDVSVYQQAVRAQLELQKQQAKSQWLADASAYIQTELQSFLNVLSQTTSTNVASSNATSVSSIDPTVQVTTATPASQQVSPAQAAQNYYQGAQTWDAKWQDLLAKQAAWEQNSFTSIQNGLTQWDQAIAGLQNDKQAYLNGIDATKAQWLANQQLIQNAENGIRTTLQNTLNGIRSQENQLKSTIAGDPILNSSFGDIDSLLASLQDSLDQHASLDTLAQSLGNFFQNQQSYADSKVAYWNTAKWQDGYATQIVNFSQQVGTDSVSCTNDFGANGCSNIVQGNRGIYYQSNGTVLGWSADSSSLIYQADVTSSVAQGSYSSSATHEDDHYTYQCFSGADFGGTCTNGHGGYRLNGEYCGNEWLFCGYTQVNNMDQKYTFTVNGNFNTSQIQDNNNIRNAILGTYNLAFSSSPDAAQAASSVSPILQGTQVYLGGTLLTSSNWFSLLGSTNQVEIQSKYKYADAAMQGNQDFWSGMSAQFSSLANTFLSLVNPLRDWESRSNQYAQEYNSKLQELDLAKQTTSQNYDDQISQMKAARDAWITSVYGYQISGYDGALDNPDSQYRQGEQAWADEIQLFQQVELNWYLSAKDTLQQALSDPQSGEEQFQTNAINQTNSLESLITNSETNTAQLYNTAVGLWDSYQYAASGNLVDQAILNKQNESLWNTQGAALSQSLADSFGRSQAYGTAALDASNRINGIITAMLGQPAQIVDNTELQSLQNQATLYGQKQTFWQNEISGANGGFDFNGKANSNQSLIDQYTAVRADITIATNLQSETVDQEKTFLNQASEYFNKSEKYLNLSATAESEGKFDEAAYYMKLSSDQKNQAMSFLKGKYSTLGDTITTEVSARGLSSTRNSFLDYRDSLLHKNFKNSQDIAKQIKDEKNNVDGIIGAGQSYDQIQVMLQSAKNLIQQGSENKGAIESLLSYSQELASRDIGGSLLDGLTEMISSIESNIPSDISSDFVAQQIAASQKEMEEKQSGVDELLSHMSSLLTNDNDLQALQTLMQGGAQSLNFAANSAVSQYLDQYSQKLQKENEERSASLQKNLFDSLTNGDEYKYLREAGYTFRLDGDRISGYRQIQSGDVAIDGNAMKDASYSAVLEYQYIQIQTKFNPGNLRVDSLNLDSLNSATFNASMVENVRDYLNSMQSQMEGMFAQFSDKKAELEQSFTQNQEIKEFQENEYKENKKETLANFQALDPSFKDNFQPTMGQTKDYHAQSGSYGFEEGSAQSQGSRLRSSFDGLGTGDKVYAGTRDLKGTVNVKGIPVEINYGKQDLLVLSSFSLDALGYDFKLKGAGATFAQDQIATVNQKYSNYLKDVEKRIEDQAKANDAEKESKGFIFTLMNGMNGGSGSIGQRFTQAVKSEVQSRMTGAIAEATGLPASFVGALVGGGSFKDAVKAFEKATINSAISEATGIPEWLISSQMDKMGKPKEQWYQSQTFQMLTTVVAVVAAPFTGGASLAVAMAVNASIGAAQGAAGGGLQGAVMGAAGGVISTYTRDFGVNVNLSYSKENGFGASVAVGIGPAAVSVGVSEHGGAQ
ncbi:hypothetical protein DLM78_13585, partial [Leptospira stimsonii]